MKGIFTTAAIATAIVGNAFGAASVRAPQLGGSAVATPATTSVARAGSMRAQTMKTTSTTTPVTTADVETPVASDATDARLSFLSSKINKLNVKSTDAAKQELNNIDARINELTAKLDQAENVQSNTVKTEDLERAINEKIEALGTATGSEGIYTKEKLNGMIPTDNGRGSITWTDPNGTLINHPTYWYITTIENNSPNSNRVDIYGYSGNHTSETITNWLNNYICPQGISPNMISCCLKRVDPTSNRFEVGWSYHGYDIFWSKIVQKNGKHMLQQYVATAENNGLAYITEEFCDGRPATECWVESEGSGTACVPITYASVYSTIDNPTPSSAPTLNDRGNMTWTDPNGNVSFELPSFSNEILGNYSKKIDNKWYACTTYQISLANWNDVVNQFIEPAVCGANGFTYGTDCILDGEPVNISTSNANGQTSFYKWVFNVCKLDNNNPVIGMVEEMQRDRSTNLYSKTEINNLLPYKENGLIYLPVLPDQPDPNSGEIGTPVPTVIAPEWRFHLVDSYTTTGGLMTVLVYSTSSNTPSEEISNFVQEVCGDVGSYWCTQYGSTTTMGTDKWFNIRKRNHGYYMFKNEIVQYNGELWEERWYDTNETQASNSSATQAYMNTQICGAAEGTENCYVLNVNQYAPGMLTPTYQVPMHVKVQTVSELPATSTLITHD